MTNYILDTNYISGSYAKCRRFGRCQSHWGFLKVLSYHSQFHWMGSVMREILDWDEFGDDLLAEVWGFSYHRFNAFAELRRVRSWVKGRYNNNQSRRRFLNPKKADAYIIAQAMKDGSNVAVVTMEKSDPNLTDTKIPDVCDALQVKWRHPNKFLEAVQPGVTLCSCLY